MNGFDLRFLYKSIEDYYYIFKGPPQKIIDTVNLQNLYFYE